jgi:hypothetical protein
MLQNKMKEAQTYLGHLLKTVIPAEVIKVVMDSIANIVSMDKVDLYNNFVIYN